MSPQGTLNITIIGPYVCLMSFQDEQQLSLGENTLWRNLDGEAVLLALDSGTYFGLNEVGTEALTLIAKGMTFGELRAALLEAFDVAEDVLSKDLNDLLSEMLRRDLIQVK